MFDHNMLYGDINAPIFITAQYSIYYITVKRYLFYSMKGTCINFFFLYLFISFEIFNYFSSQYFYNKN